MCSIDGNGPAILDRITAHRKALSAILFSGLAKGHRSNPMVGMRVERIFATPVLLSGIAALVLTKKDINMIDHHYQETLRQPLRLHHKTPRCCIYFLAGSLPGAALVHIRQLNLFSMICRLDKRNILYQHASNWFSSAVYFKGSWFHQIREWCLLYGLPHPSLLFAQPPAKNIFKTTVKKHVISYWEKMLRNEASKLKSLIMFKPEYMSLLTPHLIWRTAGHSPFKVAMANVQALLISGRYRCGALTRHWTGGDGSDCRGILEDIPHIIQWCPALKNVRLGLQESTFKYSSTLPLELMHLLRTKCVPSSTSFVSFILDCSSDPDAILLSQKLGEDIFEHLFTCTRTWAYIIHRERLKLLGLWRPVAN